MGHEGEIRADQGHRGYTTSTDADGFSQLNPLYMVRVVRLTHRANSSTSSNRIAC
jgi:hypothetical protein